MQVSDVSEKQRIDLKALIAERCIQHGDFQLKSGQRSNWLINLKDAALDSLGSNLLGQVLYNRIKDTDTTCVAGVAMGGIPLVTAIALISGQSTGIKLPALYVRADAKDYGTGKTIEGGFTPDDKILLVEDVATTGGSAIKAIDTLQAANANITGVLVVVDRGQGAEAAFAARGLSFQAIYRPADFGLK